MSKKEKKEIDIVEAMKDAQIGMDLLKISREFKKPLNIIVPGKGNWSIDFANAKIEEKLSEKPEITLEIAEETIRGLANGTTNAMQAFMQQKIKVKGNLQHLMKLQNLQPKLEKLRAKY